MHFKISPKIVMAVVLACGGVLWVWWSYTRHVPGRGLSGSSYVEPSETVKSMLGSIVFDAEPTEATVASLLDQAVQQAEDQARELSQSSNRPIRRIDDLIKVFGQSLRNTIAPDFDARCEMLRERGYRGVDQLLADEQERQQWIMAQSLRALTRFGIAQIEVRYLFQGGRRVAPLPHEEGFSISEARFSEGVLPIPFDAEKARLDILEIRLPMELPQVKEVGASGDRPTFVGYQYAWNMKRKEWTPWAICIYMDPNDVHYTISF